MPIYSRFSKGNLSTCHPNLQDLFNEVIKHFDCKVLEGHREAERQARLLASGRSKTLKSKHLLIPSRAVDVIPYPVDWRDLNRMRFFAGFVLGVASQMGINIRWGGDWDKDTLLADNTWNDFVHFEERI